jgi:predicted RND superfamily exporter protein
MLALFLRPAVAFWVCLGIPMCFLGAFLFMPLFGVSINLMSLFAFILVLGIVVDDTVHFMSKYLRARREYGMQQDDAIRYTFNTVGTAMWVTTVALTAGFLILSLSGYHMNADMGLMTALTITLALILDFLLLPVLLMKFDVTTKNRS